MEKYVTLVYLPEDEETANHLADEFAEKHVDEAVQLEFLGQFLVGNQELVAVIKPGVGN